MRSYFIIFVISLSKMSCKIASDFKRALIFLVIQTIEEKNGILETIYYIYCESLKKMLSLCNEIIHIDLSKICVLRSDFEPRLTRISLRRMFTSLHFAHVGVRER